MKFVGNFKPWLGKKRDNSTKLKISETKKNNPNTPRGVKHFAWKGGLENLKRKDERNDPMYMEWVKEIKRRDNHQCKFLNENCSGYLVVHHILPWRDYPEERYNTNNGISLCQYHHPRKRVDEQKLIPIFQELVGLNKN